MEPNCDNCKHISVAPNDPPCGSCAWVDGRYTKWEPRTSIDDATPEQWTESARAILGTPSFKATANDRQVAGDHYKSKAIQPWDYIASNGIGYLAGNAIKYLSRYKEKGGESDIRKAIHYCQKILEVEYDKKG